MNTKLYNFAYAFLFALGIASCTPTADELLQEQLTTLDTSQLISFLASVTDDKGTPITGASFTLETIGDSASTVLTATSNAEGRASFGNVAAGGYLFTVTAEGHLTATGILDFSWIEGYNFTVTDELVVGIPVTESAIIPLYPTDPATEDAATITGTVLIESDLTNTAPEALEGITVAADLSNLVSVASNGLSIRGFQFSGHDTFGCATTDASGNYSMTVPVQKDGSFITLMFPEVQFDQTVVAYEQNRIPFAAPQAVQIPTTYGPEVFYNAVVPSVPGVWATFPAPPAAGTGFAISNVTMIPRDWSAFFNVSDTQEMPVAGSGALIEVTNWGAGYEFSPTVEITDTNSEDTVNVDADLAVGISGYTLTSTITGLAADDEVAVSLFYEDEFGIDRFVNSFTVETDGSGAITQALLTAGINAAIADGEDGFGSELVKTSRVVDSIYLALPGTGGDGTVISSSQVHNLSFGGSGRDFISPSISITGGSPTTALSFGIIFGSNWSFELDNSGITTPYVLLPEIEYEYREVASGTSNLDYFVSSFVVNPNTSTGDQIGNLLEPNAAGDIVLKPLQEGTELLYTASVSIEEPRFLVTNQAHETAAGTVFISSEGEVTGLNVTDAGDGYNTKFDVTLAPTVAGLPGSGVGITLTGGEFNGVRFDWFGDYRLTNGGTNYAQFANRILSYEYAAGFTTNASLNFEIQAGETVVRDVNYGTGRQSIDID